MKKSVAVSVLLIAVLCACGLIAGCTGEEAASPAATTPGVVETTPAEVMTYRVGIDVAYKPFTCLDENGDPIGFDIDSIKWIANDQGFEVEFKGIEWSGIIPALLANKIDMVYAGMSITEERKEKVSFSDPYWTVNQAIVVKDDSELTKDDILSGDYIIGTQSGCTAADWIEENLITNGTMPSDNLKRYDNTPLAIEDLTTGRTDAVMYDSSVIHDIIKGKNMKVAGYVETNEDFGIAVRKEDTELLAKLNAGLKNLMNSPDWEDMKEKYGLSQ